MQVAASLGHAFGAHLALASLSLARLALPDACLAALLLPLAAHPALTALDVSGNSIGPLAAGALATLLSRKSRLTHLTVLLYYIPGFTRCPPPQYCCCCAFNFYYYISTSRPTRSVRLHQRR